MTPQIKKLLQYMEAILNEELQTAEQELQCKRLLLDAISKELKK